MSDTLRYRVVLKATDDGPHEHTGFDVTVQHDGDPDDPATAEAVRENALHLANEMTQDPDQGGAGSFKVVSAEVEGVVLVPPSSEPE